MTYYRIAVQTKQSTTWRWMTTKLTSLQAVLTYLQIYRCPAHAHLRIFFATSVEALEGMLAVENQGGASFSVTPEQLLSEPQRQTLAEAKTAAETLASARQRTLTTTVNAAYELGALTIPPAVGGSTALEARRLELELGAGGDHDLSYTFAFPRALPVTRAWIRLLEKVQRGELEP
jgi:hypothetical protein